MYDGVPKYAKGATFNDAANVTYQGAGTRLTEQQWEKWPQKYRNGAVCNAAKILHESLEKKKAEEKDEDASKTKFLVSDTYGIKFSIEKIISLCPNWDKSPLTADRFREMDTETTSKVIDTAWKTWYSKWRKEFKAVEIACR